MTVRGHVIGGRLVVDEPTDLPEGTEVELAVVGEGSFDLDEPQIAALRESIEEANRGELTPLAEALGGRGAHRLL